MFSGWSVSLRSTQTCGGGGGGVVVVEESSLMTTSDTNMLQDSLTLLCQAVDILTKQLARGIEDPSVENQSYP